MTKTEKRIAALWQSRPASRSKRRMTELQGLVWRDLQCAARRNRRAKAAEQEGRGA